VWVENLPEDGESRRLIGHAKITMTQCRKNLIAIGRAGWHNHPRKQQRQLAVIDES
jgi:hypothetical protein